MEKLGGSRLRELSPCAADLQNALAVSDETHKLQTESTNLPGDMRLKWEIHEPGF